jgi:hypothetical protein
MSEPLVDVIVPVHTAQRPVARAADSVLEGTTADVRVTFVCHGVAPADIRTALGSRADDDRVRLLPFDDGIASPAGPINAGLDAATARFTALLGSDDVYERGAVDAWLAVQRRDDADVVIPRIRIDGGGRPRTPPTRPFRSRDLDGVRDRLAYRTVQLGLVSRPRFPHVRMTPGLRTGEDVVQGAALWYSGARISFARRAPGYVVDVGGDDRTTAGAKQVAVDFAFLDDVLDPARIDALDHAQRQAFAIKLLRTHVLDAVRSRVSAGALDGDELAALRDVAARVATLSPSAVGVLSRRDARILVLLDAGEPGLFRLAREVGRRSELWRAGNLLPADLSRLAHREAPPRFLAAIALTR